MPGLAPPTEYSRNYVSVPQPGLLNQTQPVYSAAVVGGGTVINGMFFNRGSAADYDAWEKLGNPGWGWQGILPYFKKVNFHVRCGCTTTDGHDIDGRARTSLHLQRSWRRTIQSLVILDLMGPMGQCSPAFPLFNIQS